MSKFELIAAPVVLPPAGFDPRTVDQLPDGYGTLNLYEIRISTTNRKRFNIEALEQLGANIRDVGILQPILVRPVPLIDENCYRYEIVAGERRFRASIIAGVASVPVIVRTLTDVQAAEIQLLENVQREDPHPLEEAEGYQLLMQNHGYDADQLAEKVKKSRAYIYGRLKLCALANGAREAFLEDQVSASTALLIARIPVPQLQQKALGEILKPNGKQEPMSVREAQSWLEQRYTLSLDTAPFDPKDAKLLASAGNCTKCPKRTGNQPEIYSDAKSANVCTDPDCYAEKKAAHYQRIVVLANKKGIPFLEADEADDVLSGTWDTKVEFVTVDHHISAFSRVAPATGMAGVVSKHLSAEDLPAPVKYAKDEDGTVAAIYRREDIQAALERVGACETESAHAERIATPTDSAEATKAQSKAEAQAKERDDKIARAKDATIERITLYRKLRTHLSTSSSNLILLREIAKMMVREFALPNRILDDLYPCGRSDAAICEHIDTLLEQDCLLLIMDLSFGDSLNVEYFDVDDDEPSENYAAVLHMASLEGIEATAADIAVAKIDTDSLKNPTDVLEVIKANIDHLGQVASFIIDRAPHHMRNVEAAANMLDYFYRDGQWVKEEPAAEPTARPKLKLKPKADAAAPTAPAPAAAPDGPVVITKKSRAVEIAWPFPTTTSNA